MNITPLRICRRIIKPLIKKVPVDLKHQNASEYIKTSLLSEKPCMIARFGSLEMDTILTYLIINEYNPVKKLELLTCGGYSYWSKNIRQYMSTNAGFFPTDDSSLCKFSEQHLAASKNIDILGSWQLGEKHLSSYLQNSKKVFLRDLTPFFYDNPWSEALKDKKVLVIHPFSETISKQFYTKREKLFYDQRVLPEFDLITLKAIQSTKGTNSGFNTWFDALQYMCDKTTSIDFDIAIIGAGAYGLPLAAHIKSIGKKSIHLGGGTQLLFGIKGKRWDKRPLFQSFYNEYWTRPSKNERPVNANHIEAGCYW